MLVFPQRPRRLAILQSNYVPWRGYFDLIASVDAFVLLDSVQYTKNDWRNRNRIKTARGSDWITIPIHRSRGLATRICEAEPARRDWAIRHLDRLQQSYRSAPRFLDAWPSVREWFLTCPMGSLSEINGHFIKSIGEFLGITTPIYWSMDFDLPPGRNERLVHLCRRLKATEYISGPSAAAYLQQEQFASEGIAVRYFDYEGFVPYGQVHPPFDPFVSVLDPIFHAGREASRLVLRQRATGARAA